MEKESPVIMIPQVVYEDTMARWERTLKRLIVVIVIQALIIAFGVYQWTQYDCSTVTVDSKDGGNASYIGDDGAINNAESGSAETSEKE